MDRKAAATLLARYREAVSLARGYTAARRALEFLPGTTAMAGRVLNSEVDAAGRAENLGRLIVDAMTGHVTLIPAAGPQTKS